MVPVPRCPAHQRITEHGRRYIPPEPPRLETYYQTWRTVTPAPPPTRSLLALQIACTNTLRSRSRSRSRAKTPWSEFHRNLCLECAHARRRPTLRASAQPTVTRVCRHWHLVAMPTPLPALCVKSILSGELRFIHALAAPGPRPYAFLLWKERLG